MLAWWKALDKSMAALECKRLQSDSGLFVHKSKSSTVVVIVYVDDALFMGNDNVLVNKLKSDFMNKCVTRPVLFISFLDYWQVTPIWSPYGDDSLIHSLLIGDTTTAYSTRFTNTGVIVTQASSFYRPVAPLVLTDS